MRIVHVLRAPVGGLFRHVADLARAQATRGHDVGVLCDSEANDGLTEMRLAVLSSILSLGLERTAMSRDIGWRDATATRATVRLAGKLNADVLHGHGAKGGAYARLAAALMKRRGHTVTSIYTPHGGSLHYAPTSIKGRIFMALERRLARTTDGIVFESAYASRIFAQQVGVNGAARTLVIPNGIREDELASVATEPDAADFVFVGELRRLKGVDLLLTALASIGTPHPPTAVIVGDGPDAAEFKAQSERLGLTDRVSFPGAMPAREAFTLGRTLVMPSRAESFPYIVLEAGGAALPMIATAVGGIPEIVAGSSMRLVPPEDAGALASAMVRHLVDPVEAMRIAVSLRSVIAARYSVERMTDSILALYHEIAQIRSLPMHPATAPIAAE